jgi:hypothetical protein
MYPLTTSDLESTPPYDTVRGGPSDRASMSHAAAAIRLADEPPSLDPLPQILATPFLHPSSNNASLHDLWGAFLTSFLVTSLPPAPAALPTLIRH